jgi:hypothetical protein
LSVRVIPQGDPDGAVVAETLVAVQPFDDRRITTLQPVQRARRRATFEFMVENHGNNLASCRLHLVDASDRVDGTFDPPAVGVTPGSASLVRLRMRANRAFFRRAERQLDFEIEATEPDHEPATGRATLIQPPTVSLLSLARSVGLAAAVVAVVAAWFGVVRPELRDAADRAVEERIAEIGIEPDATTPATTVAATDDEPEAPPEVVAAAEIGEPVSYRIPVDVGITQNRSESISIPPDARFRLTDVVLQNPNGDFGTAQLLRNGELLYEWDLGSMNTANEFQPRVSPLPFEPGDNVVLAVTCDALGQPGGTVCEIAVLLGGLLVPTES